MPMCISKSIFTRIESFAASDGEVPHPKVTADDLCYVLRRDLLGNGHVLPPGSGGILQNSKASFDVLLYGLRTHSSAILRIQSDALGAFNQSFFHRNSPMKNFIPYFVAVLGQ